MSADSAKPVLARLHVSLMEAREAVGAAIEQAADPAPAATLLSIEGKIKDAEAAHSEVETTLYG
ncbi:MAG TPA: hypothetical protein VFI03_12210 [Solirubrobacterales bacterium]|nr:hypothetical protein [Solirubrobacterales bacterium]